MNHRLSILDETGKPILQMDIPPIDPMHAHPAIVAAIAKLPPPKPPKKTRSDAGIKRPAKAVAPELQPPLV